MIEAVPVAVSCPCQSWAVSAGCLRAAPRGAHPELSLINSQPCPCKAIGLAQHKLLTLSRRQGEPNGLPHITALPFGADSTWNQLTFCSAKPFGPFFLGPLFLQREPGHLATCTAET